MGPALGDVALRPGAGAGADAIGDQFVELLTPDALRQLVRRAYKRDRDAETVELSTGLCITPALPRPETLRLGLTLCSQA